MSDRKINPRAKGPEIPGLYYIGNHGGPCSDENAAIESYRKSLQAIPREAFRAIVHQPFGVDTVAVYCESEYAAIAEAWVMHVQLLLEAFIQSTRDEWGA